MPTDRFAEFVQSVVNQIYQINFEPDSNYHKEENIRDVEVTVIDDEKPRKLIYPDKRALSSLGGIHV